ncbi:hypothetical protein L207DRAFT_640121 [Hyaloscypha variabilis F]|uniref:Uncharacterized protein n=1 Tax=Hyaloscypha variabilis (strain UAMH 11265 / GT02V1 / F) TaxID=1149755 RepID=A0A2J6R1B9_HYAVF|nr:hypothetical protein L207DRAFT_640121 [Hyaloscypha variabilis F]
MWRFLKIFGLGVEERRDEKMGGEVSLLGDGRDEAVGGDDVRGPVEHDLESFGFEPERGGREEFGAKMVIDKQLREAAKKERRKEARTERQRAVLEGRRLGVRGEGKRERTMSKASLTGGEDVGVNGETAAEAAAGTASSASIGSQSLSRRRLAAIWCFLCGPECSFRRCGDRSWCECLAGCAMRDEEEHGLYLYCAEVGRQQNPALACITSQISTSISAKAASTTNSTHTNPTKVYKYILFNVWLEDSQLGVQEVFLLST